MPGMKIVTITNRLLHFMIILSYCGNLYLALTISVIIFIAVKSCRFVKVYCHKTSPGTNSDKIQGGDQRK